MLNKSTHPKGGRFNTYGDIRFSNRVTAGKFRAIAARICEAAVDQYTVALQANVLPLDWHAVWIHALAEGHAELTALIIDDDGQVRLQPFIDLLWAYPQLMNHYAAVKAERDGS